MNTLKIMGYNRIDAINICLVNPRNPMLAKEVGKDLLEAFESFGGYFMTRMTDRQDQVEFAIQSEAPSLFTSRHNIEGSDVVFLDELVWNFLDSRDQAIVLDHIRLSYPVTLEADYLRVSADMRTMGPRRSQSIDVQLVEKHGFRAMSGFISRYCGTLIRVYYGHLGWWKRIRKSTELSTQGDFGARRDFIFTCKDINKRS